MTLCCEARRETDRGLVAELHCVWLAARVAARTGYPVMQVMAIQVTFISDVLMHRTEQVG
jgi:hypothetical protein